MGKLLILLLLLIIYSEYNKTVFYPIPKLENVDVSENTDDNDEQDGSDNNNAEPPSFLVIAAIAYWILIIAILSPVLFMN